MSASPMSLDRLFNLMAEKNASDLFQFPVPQSVIDDPESFGAPVAV